MDLTKRENQIAGLAFCGLAKKEIADKLNIAEGTVNVLLDKAYKKTGTNKLNELGSWWANYWLDLGIDFHRLEIAIVNGTEEREKERLINVLMNK